MKKWKLMVYILTLVLGIGVLTGCVDKPPSITAADVNFTSVEDIEKNLFDIIKLTDLSEDEISSVILSLEDLNWKDLKEKGGKKFKKDFANWIGEKEIKEIEEISSIIGVMSNFDKKDYVRLSTKLAEIFGKDRIIFVKALSNKKWNLAELAYAFYDLSIYEEGSRTLAADFNEIVNSEELSKEEKYIGLEFIDTIANCDT